MSVLKEKHDPTEIERKKREIREANERELAERECRECHARCRPESLRACPTCQRKLCPKCYPLVGKGNCAQCTAVELGIIDEDGIDAGTGD